MAKQTTYEIDPDVLALFKSKVAIDRLTMADVLRWAVDDYLSGKWKPRPRDRQKVVNSKN